MQHHAGCIDTPDSLRYLIQLERSAPSRCDDADRKIEQIKAFTSLLDAEVRRSSSRRRLVFVDNAAGNCHLSFFVYHRYVVGQGRNIEIHCVDSNARLMENARRRAAGLGYSGLHFHACDILQFDAVTNADITYSLHACDSATDKAIYCGIALKARSIFSVACCQHGAARRMSSRGLRGPTRYKVFRERLVYMIGDTMRAHLMGLHGYDVDAFEFVSSRFTDKNTMIRGRRRGAINTTRLEAEYRELRERFRFEPELSRLLAGLSTSDTE